VEENNWCQRVCNLCYYDIGFLIYMLLFVFFIYWMFHSIAICDEVFKNFDPCLKDPDVGKVIEIIEL